MPEQLPGPISEIKATRGNEDGSTTYIWEGGREVTLQPDARPDSLPQRIESTLLARQIGNRQTWSYTDPVTGAKEEYASEEAAKRGIAARGKELEGTQTQYLVNPESNKIEAVYANSYEAKKRIEEGWRAPTQAEVEGQLFTKAEPVAGKTEAPRQSWSVKLSDGSDIDLSGLGVRSEEEAKLLVESDDFKRSLPKGVYLAGTKWTVTVPSSGNVMEFDTPEAAKVFADGLVAMGEVEFDREMSRYKDGDKYRLADAIADGVDTGLLVRGFGMQAVYDTLQAIQEGKAVEAAQRRLDAVADSEVEVTPDSEVETEPTQLLGSGERVPSRAYLNLSEGDRAALNELGIDEFNAFKEREYNKAVASASLPESERQVILGEMSSLGFVEPEPTPTPTGRGARYNLVKALSEGYDVSKLRSAFGTESVSEAESALSAVRAIEPFKTDGGYDLNKAVASGVTENELLAAGFPQADVDRALGKRSPVTWQHAVTGKIISDEEYRALGYTAERDKYRLSPESLLVSASSLAQLPQRILNTVIPESQPGDPKTFGEARREWVNIRTGKKITGEQYTALGSSSKRDEYVISRLPAYATDVATTVVGIPATVLTYLSLGAPALAGRVIETKDVVGTGKEVISGLKSAAITVGRSLVDPRSVSAKEKAEAYGLAILVLKGSSGAVKNAAAWVSSRGLPFSSLGVEYTTGRLRARIGEISDGSVGVALGEALKKSAEPGVGGVVQAPIGNSGLYVNVLKSPFQQVVGNVLMHATGDIKPFTKQPLFKVGDNPLYTDPLAAVNFALKNPVNPGIVVVVTDVSSKIRVQPKSSLATVSSSEARIKGAAAGTFMANPKTFKGEFETEVVLSPGTTLRVPDVNRSLFDRVFGDRPAEYFTAYRNNVLPVKIAFDTGLKGKLPSLQLSALDNYTIKLLTLRQTLRLTGMALRNPKTTIQDFWERRVGPKGVREVWVSRKAPSAAELLRDQRGELGSTLSKDAKNLMDRANAELSRISKEEWDRLDSEAKAGRTNAALRNAYRESVIALLRDYPSVSRSYNSGGSAKSAFEYLYLKSLPESVSTWSEVVSRSYPIVGDALSAIYRQQSPVYSGSGTVSAATARPLVTPSTTYPVVGGTTSITAIPTRTSTPTAPIRITPILPVTGTVITPVTIERPPDGVPERPPVSPPVMPPGRTPPTASPPDRPPARPPDRVPPRLPPTQPPTDDTPVRLASTSGNGGNISVPAGSIAWKQGLKNGRGWYYIPPPWNQDKPIFVDRPPAGARLGGRTPAETIQVIGKPKSKVPKTASIDLGIADVYISDYGRHIEFAGKGEDTDVGLRLGSRTKGMSIPAVSAGVSRERSKITASLGSRRQEVEMADKIVIRQVVPQEEADQEVVEEVVEEGSSDPFGDTFRVTDRDIMGGSNDLSDVLSVSGEDILQGNSTFAPAKKRVVRRVVRRAPPTNQLGGYR